MYNSEIAKKTPKYSRAAGKNDRGDLQRLPPLFTALAGGEDHCHLQQE